jgi:hypothetical protein
MAAVLTRRVVTAPQSKRPGRYLADASVAAQHWLVNAMSLVEAASPVIDTWARDRLSDQAVEAGQNRSPEVLIDQSRAGELRADIS